MKNAIKFPLLALLSSLMLVAISSYASSADTSVEAIFAEKYAAWQHILHSTTATPPPNSRHPLNQPFWDIVDLGAPALPLIIEKVRAGDQTIVHALVLIAKVGINDEYGLTPGTPLTQPYYKYWLQWWDEKRPNSAQLFKARFDAWKLARQQQRLADANAAYESMRDLGIFALPGLTEQIAQGESDLIPMVAVLTNNAIDKSATRAQVAEWWNKNKQKWTLPEQTSGSK
jgi:hypothetical protein